MEEARDHETHESHHTGLIPTWLCSHKYRLLKNDSILQTQRTENSPSYSGSPWVRRAALIPPTRPLLIGQECRSTNTAKEKM